MLLSRSDLQSKDGYYAEIRLQYDPEEQAAGKPVKYWSRCFLHVSWSLAKAINRIIGQNMSMVL